MDIELISPEALVPDLGFWRSLATARRHRWHGKALSFLPPEIDGYNLDLVDVIDGSLMARLGVSMPVITCPTSQGAWRHSCSAFMLTFGREIDLGPLWVREELSDLFLELFLTVLKTSFGDLEARVTGFSPDVLGAGGTVVIHATGNYAYTAFDDFSDPAQPLVRVLLPAFTFDRQAGWLFLDPRFWIGNKVVIEDIVDNAMFDAYDRATQHFGLGQSAAKRAAS